MNRLSKGGIAPTDSRGISRLQALYIALWNLNAAVALANDLIERICPWYYGFHFGLAYDYYGPEGRPSRLASEFLRGPGGIIELFDDFQNAARLVPSGIFPDDLAYPYADLMEHLLQRLGGLVKGGPAIDVCTKVSKDLLHVLTHLDMNLPQGASWSDCLANGGEDFRRALDVLCDVLEQREKTLLLNPCGFVLSSPFRPPDMTKEIARTISTTIGRVQRELHAKRKAEYELPSLKELTEGQFKQLEAAVRYSIEHPTASIHNCCKVRFRKVPGGFASYKTLYCHARRRKDHWELMCAKLKRVA